MNPKETATVLIILEQGMPAVEAEASLQALGDTVLGWAQVFDDKPLYAIKVPQAEAKEWKEALLRMQGVVWSEIMLGPPTFETPGIYH